MNKNLNRIKKNKQYFLQDREFLILSEIFNELKNTSIAFLLSATSLKQFYRIKGELNRNQKYNLKISVNNLNKKGYLKMKKNGEILLTKLGEQIYNRQNIINKNENKIKSDWNKNWDKKWRMISFDIPVEFNSVRYSLRQILLRAGFLQIQKSVYVFPFEIDDLLIFLKENKEFKKFIIYSIISESTASKKWEKQFKSIINKK